MRTTFTEPIHTSYFVYTNSDPEVENGLRELSKTDAKLVYHESHRTPMGNVPVWECKEYHLKQLHKRGWWTRVMAWSSTGGSMLTCVPQHTMSNLPLIRSR